MLTRRDLTQGPPQGEGSRDCEQLTSVSGEQLARLIAADLGGAVEVETVKILRGETTRTVGLSEVLAAAALIAQCAQLAAQFWQGRRDREALLRHLAAHTDAPKPIDAGARGAIIGMTVAKIAEGEATNQNASRSAAQPPDEGMARTPQELMAECLGNELTRGGFGKPLHFGPFAAMDFFYVLRAFHWEPDQVDNPGTVAVEVPVGFVTDLASVPPPFRAIIKPYGRHGQAAVMHDWLYWQQSTTRDTADRTFAAIMKDLSVPSALRVVISKSVEAFGGLAWAGNKRRREAGERRILKRLPDDPKITWEDWRLQPDVFA